MQESKHEITKVASLINSGANSTLCSWSPEVNFQEMSTYMAYPNRNMDSMVVLRVVMMMT